MASDDNPFFRPVVDSSEVKHETPHGRTRRDEDAGERTNAREQVSPASAKEAARATAAAGICFALDRIVSFLQQSSETVE